MEVDDLSVDGAVALAIDCIKRRESCRIVTPNSEFGMRARENKRFCDILNSARISLADGIGVVLASKILGCPLPQKSAGVEFGEKLCAALARENMRLFLLGAGPGVAQKAAENLTKKYPGLVISGTHDGYFSDDAAVVDLIASSRSDALFVCMGSPRQEYFLEENEGRLGVYASAALGGSMDIYAGIVNRAPKIFIDTGFEWLYRLILEPKRIKRMIKLPLYLVYAFFHRIKHGKSA